MSDRYISVKFLEEVMQRHKPLSGSDSTKERYAFMEWLGIYNAIKDAPTVEAVPVRKGKWIRDYKSLGMVWNCSKCGSREFGHAEYLSKFCDNCGADMRGEAERSE